MRYAIAPNGIFWSTQGEGHLRGFQMAFVRLAGCPIACPNCDTDYSVGRRLQVKDILSELADVVPRESRDRWVWLTGGEPANFDTVPLVAGLKAEGYSVCVATSGSFRYTPPVDWLSVSPHDYKTKQLYGNEIKLVAGLNDLDPFKWLHRFPDSKTDFWYRYVQPVSVPARDINGGMKECPESLELCKKFIKLNPNWSLSRQDHVYWGVQ